MSKKGTPASIKLLSPEAQEAWLKSKHRPAVSMNLAEYLSGWSSGMQVTFIKNQDAEPERRDFERRVKASDRAELVRPAPRGFRPERARRKVKLTLVGRNAFLKKGESFWYRLELQNIGQETISFRDQISFWKSGDLEPNRYKFFVTPPGGKERKVRFLYLGGCGFEQDIPLPGWEKMSKEEREETLDKLRQEVAVERAYWGSLYVDLAPGETLVTRSWRHIRGAECLRLAAQGFHGLRVPGQFRELALMGFRFDKPGTYRIKAVLHDPPPRRPREEEIQRKIKLGIDREYQMKTYEERRDRAWGVIESNMVSVEVLP